MKSKQTRRTERRGGARAGSGRKAQDGAHGVQRLSVTLDAAAAERARELGDGNVSLGIRKAINQGWR